MPTGHPKRPKQDVRLAHDISARVRRFYLDGESPRFKSQAELARAFRKRANTVTGWLHPYSPKIPEPETQVRMTERDDLNLNWLLLGPPHPECLSASVGPPVVVTPDFRRTLVERLAVSTKVDAKVIGEVIPPVGKLWAVVERFFQGELVRYVRARVRHATRANQGNEVRAAIRALQIIYGPGVLDPDAPPTAIATTRRAAKRKRREATRRRRKT